MRAIKADPKHANNLGNYGLFLADARGDADKAETYCKSACRKLVMPGGGGRFEQN